MLLVQMSSFITEALLAVLKSFFYGLKSPSSYIVDIISPSGGDSHRSDCV